MADGAIRLKGNLLLFGFWWRAMKVVTPTGELPAMTWFGMAPEFKQLLATRAELTDPVRRFNRAARLSLVFGGLTGFRVGSTSTLLGIEFAEGGNWSEQHPLAVQMAANITLLLLGIAYLWGLELYRRLKRLCELYNRAVAAEAVGAAQERR
jgi:hypothetical protein